MRQQINLYQPIFSEAKQPLSAATVSMCLVLIVACLIAYSSYTSSRLGKLAAQVASHRSEQTQLETRLNEMTAEMTARSNPEVVEARVKVLAASLNERTKALELLKAGAVGQTTGFAARLEALARRHVDGLWIDRLVISGSTGSMSLAGATLDADIVPVYLQSLAQESVLTGTRFDEFIIERPTAVAAVADSDEPSEVKQPAKGKFIRFRAGNRALDQAKGQGEKT
jgi:hypothetical protein